MITLRKFYFEPNMIENKEINPIFFEKGLNIILGERSIDSEKMNSVGKSLLIDMINYCLLSDSSIRIPKIPDNLILSDTYMCLDFELETETKISNITIKRSRDINKPILIISNDNEQEFDKLEHAKDFIESLILNNDRNINMPSFRNLISILIREEKSAYDDILRPYASKNYLDFNDLIRPHLYLFGFDISIVDKMKHIQKNISSTKTTIENLNKSFKDMGIDLRTIRSYINNLEEIVNKLNISVNELKPGEGLQQIRDRLLDLELQLDKLIVQKSAKEGIIKKIKKLPKLEQVDSKKIEIIYNTFKEGLGTIVKKSLDEVKEFHETINTFQNQLFNQHLHTVQKEIEELDEQINKIDIEISDIYREMKADEKIDSMKKAVKEEKSKNDELVQVSNKYLLLEQKKVDKKSYEKARDDLLDELDKLIKGKEKNIRSFEDDLKILHKVITGNTKCQFDIKTSHQKDYIVIDYRIDLDGGSGMDRIRTFMYDVLLLLSKVTSPRHLGFLIHDNIFPSTGRDDMVKSLNYIYGQSKINKNFQYIVTLNIDEFEAQINKFSFKTSTVTKATFTRETPFLGTQYRES